MNVNKVIKVKSSCFEYLVYDYYEIKLKIMYNLIFFKLNFVNFTYIECNVLQSTTAAPLSERSNILFSKSNRFIVITSV